jgi:cell division topological specificity factor
MFENVSNFFKKVFKKENQKESNSGKEAKERLHLVLMQDRANVSADFLEMMKQEIIEVIKKYIDVDENSIDVRLTNQPNEDGSNGAPALYANIPIISIKEDQKVEENKEEKEKTKKETEEKVENKEQEENSETIEETESSEPKEGKHSLENEEEKEQEDKSEEESKE